MRGSSYRAGQRRKSRGERRRKVRVYEIARKLGMTSDEVMGRLRAGGEVVTRPSSTVHAAVADRLTAAVRGP
jgi:hypothetical protein